MESGYNYSGAAGRWRNAVPALPFARLNGSAADEFSVDAYNRRSFSFPSPPDFTGGNVQGLRREPMTHAFKIRPVEGEAKVTIYPGTANLLMPTIGATALDDATSPELDVVSGPVYVELHFRGGTALSAEVKNAATLPLNVAGASPRYIQIGTVAVSGSDVTVTAQIVTANIAETLTSHPWRMTGYIESGDAKIHLVPATVNFAVPVIGSDSLAEVPPPAITVTGASGQIWVRATVDAAGVITALALANLTSTPTDTATLKHNLVGTWTASGGAFTSVTSILNTNQAFRVCGGNAEWY